MLAVSYSHQSFEPIQSEIHSSNTKESKGKERKGEKRRRRKQKRKKTERQIGTNDPKQNKETNYVNPLVIMARDPKYIIKKKREKKGREERERKVDQGREARTRKSNQKGVKKSLDRV